MPIFGRCQVCDEKERTIARLEEENRELRDVLISVKAGPNIVDKIRETRQIYAANEDGEQWSEDAVVGEVDGQTVTASDLRERFNYWHGGGAMFFGQAADASVSDEAKEQVGG